MEFQRLVINAPFEKENIIPNLDGQLCILLEKKPEFIGFFSTAGWKIGKGWELVYPVPRNPLLVFCFHRKCAPNVGYEVEISRLLNEGLSKWYMHLKTKSWFMPGVIYDALLDVRKVHFPITARHDRQKHGLRLFMKSQSIKGETTMPESKVRFYRNEPGGEQGASWCIETAHEDLDNFLTDVSRAIVGILPDDDSDIELCLSNLLPKIVEISAKLKGYKADVSLEHVIRAGSLPPGRNQMVWPKINGSR